jgi:hypothetical protein
LWRCQQSTWIPKAAHDQAAYLVKLIDRHLQGHPRWFRPISHIVLRKEDQLQYQDASSSYGLGGHIPALQIYWTLAWTEFGPAIQNWINTTLNQGKDEDAHINWLEYLAQFCGLCLTSILEKQNPTPWPAFLYQIGDNTMANKAAGSGTARTTNKVTAAICRMRCTLQ